MEKLTKAALKQELKRRIEWFEQMCGFTDKSSLANCRGKYNMYAFGFYCSYRLMLWQIDNNLFLDGFVKQ